MLSGRGKSKNKQESEYATYMENMLERLAIAEYEYYLPKKEIQRIKDMVAYLDNLNQTQYMQRYSSIAAKYNPKNHKSVYEAEKVDYNVPQMVVVDKALPPKKYEIKDINDIIVDKGWGQRGGKISFKDWALAYYSYYAEEYFAQELAQQGIPQVQTEIAELERDKLKIDEQKAKVSEEYKVKIVAQKEAYKDISLQLTEAKQNVKNAEKNGTSASEITILQKYVTELEQQKNSIKEQKEALEKEEKDTLRQLSATIGAKSRSITVLKDKIKTLQQAANIEMPEYGMNFSLYTGIIFPAIVREAIRVPGKYKIEGEGFARVLFMEHPLLEYIRSASYIIYSGSGYGSTIALSKIYRDYFVGQNTPTISVKSPILQAQIQQSEIINYLPSSDTAKELVAVLQGQKKDSEGTVSYYTSASYYSNEQKKYIKTEKADVMYAMEEVINDGDVILLTSRYQEYTVRKKLSEELEFTPKPSATQPKLTKKVALEFYKFLKEKYLSLNGIMPEGLVNEIHDKNKKLVTAQMLPEERQSVQYYPTPPRIVDMMIRDLDVQDNETVLEPSAGLGNIADKIRQAAPQSKIYCIEAVKDFRIYLASKGYDILYRNNFLYFGTDKHESSEAVLLPYNEKGSPKWDEAKVAGQRNPYLEQHPDFYDVKFDKIAMNPPFFKGIDFVHVQHAYQFLKPGGRLVAIISAQTLLQRDATGLNYSREAIEAQYWIKNEGGTYKIIEPKDYSIGMSADAKVGGITIPIAYIVLNKPKEYQRNDKIYRRLVTDYERYLRLPKKGKIQLPEQYGITSTVTQNSTFVKPELYRYYEAQSKKQPYNVRNWLGNTIYNAFAQSSFKYQVDGVNMAIDALENPEGQGGFLLADGTGAGKTVQQLLLAAYYSARFKPARPSLIVTIDDKVIEKAFLRDAANILGIDAPNYPYKGTGVANKEELGSRAQRRPKTYEGLFDENASLSSLENEYLTDEQYDTLYESKQYSNHLADDQPMKARVNTNGVFYNSPIKIHRVNTKDEVWKLQPGINIMTYYDLMHLSEPAQYGEISEKINRIKNMPSRLWAYVKAHISNETRYGGGGVIKSTGNVEKRVGQFLRPDVQKNILAKAIELHKKHSPDNLHNMPTMNEIMELLYPNVGATANIGELLVNTTQNIQLFYMQFMEYYLESINKRIKKINEKRTVQNAMKSVQQAPIPTLTFLYIRDRAIVTQEGKEYYAQNQLKPNKNVYIYSTDLEEFLLKDNTLSELDEWCVKITESIKRGMYEEFGKELSELEVLREKIVNTRFEAIKECGVVIWDEAHKIKNMYHADYTKITTALYAKIINKYAPKVMYCTATPADRPMDVLYLQRAGVFRDEYEYQQFMDNIGYKEKRFRYVDKNGIGRSGVRWVKPKGSSTADMYYRSTMYLKSIFEEMYIQGTMIRREIPLSNFEYMPLMVKLPEEQNFIIDQVRSYVQLQSRLAGNRFSTNTFYQKVLQELEVFKVETIIALVRKIVEEENGSVIIYVQNLDLYSEEKAKAAKKAKKKSKKEDDDDDISNLDLDEDIDDDNIDDNTDDDTTLSAQGATVTQTTYEQNLKNMRNPKPGTARILRNRLAELYGWEQIAMLIGTDAGFERTEQAIGVDEFNEGKRRIIIATPKSGGTGISLDDTVGNMPRSIIIATAPLSFIETMQIVGRIVRANTKSPSKTYMLFGENNPVEDWLKRLYDSKFAILKSIVGGETSKIGESKTKKTLEELATDAEAQFIEAMENAEFHPLIMDKLQVKYLELLNDFSTAEKAFGGGFVLSLEQHSLPYTISVENYTAQSSEETAQFENAEFLRAVIVRATSKAEIDRFGMEAENLIDELNMVLDSDKYTGSYYRAVFDGKDFMAIFNAISLILNLYVPESVFYARQKASIFAEGDRIALRNTIVTTGLSEDDLPAGLQGVIKEVKSVTLFQQPRQDGSMRDIKQYVFHIVFDNGKEMFRIAEKDIYKL